MLKDLQRAAKVNQEGASLLELGDTSKALKCFRSSLKLVNECCQKGLAHKLPTKGLNAALLGSTPVRLSRSSGEEEFYSQVFDFDPEGKVTVQKQSYCSAVLIFNCALALHQKGYTQWETEKNYSAYTKALLFYSQALNLLRPFTETPECFQIIQEIMKNQADIYYKINDLGNVQRVMEELVHLAKERQGSGSAELRPNTRIASTA